MKKGIAVAGTILLDKINEISAYPNSGELTKIKAIQYAVGGMVPNDGIDIKKIKPDIPVKALGKVGADGEGKFVLNVLKENGLDVSGVIIDQKEKTSFTDVMSVVGGQRTFFTYAGASADFGFDSIDWENLDVKMLHLGYFLLLDKVDGGDGLKILMEAKKRDIKTSIDLVSENSDRYNLVRPCLPYVDNLIVNETEGCKLCGLEVKAENIPTALQALKDLGVRERVIIHTPEFGMCFDGKNITTVKSFKLPDGYIKGTTGAGDAFCAGALIGIYEGRSDEEILEMATVSAACSLRTADATGGMETYEEMDKFCSRFEKR